jgi:hypothetical protein
MSAKMSTGTWSEAGILAAAYGACGVLITDGSASGLLLMPPVLISIAAAAAASHTLFDPSARMGWSALGRGLFAALAACALYATLVSLMRGGFGHFGVESIAGLIAFSVAPVLIAAALVRGLRRLAPRRRQPAG